MDASGLAKQIMTDYRSYVVHHSNYGQSFRNLADWLTERQRCEKLYPDAPQIFNVTRYDDMALKVQALTKSAKSTTTKNEQVICSHKELEREISIMSDGRIKMTKTTIGSNNRKVITTEEYTKDALLRIVLDHFSKQNEPSPSVKRSFDDI